MDKVQSITLMLNSGLNVLGMDSNFYYIEDPSCIFPAFDKIFDLAWIVALVLTAFMLFGWGALYIKNGVKIKSAFNNAKSLILIFAVFSLVKPIVNSIYGEKLFSQQCEAKPVSIAKVNELLEQRNKKFSKSDQYNLYENFSVFDTGRIYPESEDYDAESETE